jgi:KDO2-lipid IV(A) lauroyltransferase
LIVRRASERGRELVAAILAAVAAFVVGDVFRVRRSHVEGAMARAGVLDPVRSARAMYRNLGKGLFELLLAAIVRSDGALRHVAVPEQAIAALRARGRGAVVATAHTGNWDLCACAVAAVVPLSVVTKRLRIRWLDALWQGARRRRSVRLLAIGRAAGAATDALRRGELVAMLVDQAPERRRGVTSTRFLGESAWVDLAPALVAMRARAPLVVAFPRREPDGRHSVEIAAVLEPPEKPSRAWAVGAMTEATRRLECFVMRHPDQWLWMHRRWKALPPDARSGRSATARLAGGTT